MENMRLYLIQRSDEIDWDEYAGFVVCAKSKADARTIFPSFLWQATDKNFVDYYNAEIIYLGKASRSVKRGIIITDFKAG